MVGASNFTAGPHPSPGKRALSQDEPTADKERFQPPEPASIQERTLELPAVIIGDRGEDSAPLEVRLLPGRVHESLVLYPAYIAVGVAALLAAHFAFKTGEWNVLMTFLGWGLLYCWYWVYGVAYRYRRWIMKYFSFMMSLLTASSLAFVSALRAAATHVPTPEGLVLREPQPLIFLAAILTTLSAAAILAHMLFLGRGYREKALTSTSGKI